jgi:SAM-dependent methyltransferase
VRYLFPRHPREVNRLDLQHYAFREALGANYLAPIGRPERILDVGTGTGRWCLDMIAEFPQAFAVGLDVVVGKPVLDRRYGPVRGDVTAGLPFVSECFDFVHQRLLRSGIPVVAWPDAVADLVRVTRSGGWVELFEIGDEQMRQGPATAELFGGLLRLATAQGLDSDGSVVFHLDRLLTEAGLEDVTARRIELPVGEWGGRPGSFLASDMRAMFTRLAPAFEARFSVPQERTLELTRTALSECQELHSSAVFLGAWGRRPD